MIPGRKIAVIGLAGSGKSTLARRLNRQLDLPLYHTDQFIWADGWDSPRPNDAILAYVERVLREPR